MKSVLVFHVCNEGHHCFTEEKVKVKELDKSFIHESFIYYLKDDTVFPVGTSVEFEDGFDFEVESLWYDVKNDIFKMIVGIGNFGILIADFVKLIRKNWDVYPCNWS